MSLSRREFLKVMGGTAAAFAFPGVILQGCKKALQEATARTPVIWLQGQSCSGCSVSLLNKLNPDSKEAARAAARDVPKIALAPRFDLFSVPSNLINAKSIAF